MTHHSPFETSLLKALRALEDAVSAGRTSVPNPALRPALAQVEELSKQIPSDTDAQLRHFLQRGSFQKARLWLEGTRD